MNKLIQLILAVSVTVAFSANAYAECRRAHVCDGYGQNCRYQDICDSKLDLPSVGLNPLPALPSVELKPLPSMNLPPLGTSKCEYKQVNGQWQNVCF
jgi:hypothetical protein